MANVHVQFSVKLENIGNMRFELEWQSKRHDELKDAYTVASIMVQDLLRDRGILTDGVINLDRKRRAWQIGNQRVAIVAHIIG